MSDLQGLVVRQANLADTQDAQALIQLMDHYARDPMGGGSGLSDHSRRNLVEALHSRVGCWVLLAYLADEPVGLLTAIEGFSTFRCQPLLNIHDLIVDRNHRGQGISRQLMAAIEQIALEQGCCKLTLEVLEGNEIAQAAYRAFGFAGYQLDPKMGQALFWEKAL